MSVIASGWLGCCEPQMHVEKQARIDASDSWLIWYRICLLNRVNISLAARITDALPAGLQLLNASVQPQMDGLNLAWVTDEIPEAKAVSSNTGLLPGETASL